MGVDFLPRHRFHVELVSHGVYDKNTRQLLETCSETTPRSTDNSYLGSLLGKVRFM